MMMEHPDTLAMTPSVKWPPLWRGLAVASLAAMVFAWLGFTHEQGSDYGALSLLPAALVITMAVITRVFAGRQPAGALADQPGRFDQSAGRRDPGGDDG
ncbi:hypothetical protein AB9R83_11085 [Oceanimonas smirnovii]|uniref:hypothetical protein n=1 Tax=Oceanimonas smirnovii TaxID=264574 RepID=UPI003AAB162E